MPYFEGQVSQIKTSRHRKFNLVAIQK